MKREYPARRDVRPTPTKSIGESGEKGTSINTVPSDAREVPVKDFIRELDDWREVSRQKGF